jgi:hypothetical protein
LNSNDRNRFVDGPCSEKFEVEMHRLFHFSLILVGCFALRCANPRAFELGDEHFQRELEAAMVAGAAASEDASSYLVIANENWKRAKDAAARGDTRAFRLGTLAETNAEIARLIALAESAEERIAVKRAKARGLDPRSLSASRSDR